MFRAGLLVSIVCGLIFHADALLCSAAAQAPPKAEPQAKAPRHLSAGLLRGQSKIDANAGTVTIMTQRTLDGPIMRAVLDLSVLLDDGERFEKMRILPIVARGKMQNLWDILYLNGVDMGFLQTDTLEVLKDDPQIDYIKSRIHYIAVMFPEEIAVVARSDITSLKDLAGKKVSINARGTAANVTAPIIFRRLGIDAQLEPEESDTAIARIRSGDLAAHVWLLGKPAGPIRRVKGDGLHILPIPFTEALLDYYLPSKFTSEDYPNLIPPGQVVETVAIGQILAVINVPENSERYKKLARFVEAFFTRFDELRKPGFLPLWKDVNIAAETRGWTRFKAAQDWLDRRPRLETTAEHEPSEAPKVSGPGGEAERQKLFREFLKWQRSGNR
ncbi:MAG: hypothetical protein J2P50_15020 [Hyphomicrobiaceae bacterium]|nr:hypothetical protein [Hyphomicrobiaceae bacterium]